MASNNLAEGLREHRAYLRRGIFSPSCAGYVVFSAPLAYTVEGTLGRILTSICGVGGWWFIEPRFSTSCKNWVTVYTDLN
ncbi:hypothetical protein B0T17DRAFT_542366 [Bombardia bombarda]|uniref:Uncharacterized protein n=1 Tax=Bombardia bombarda TaxID=252184 RepID=A0AA39TIP8_9PEZI|nr:hypothetical protein B0T17DRAFT_542366 [Bombardia bombarda]